MGFPAKRGAITPAVRKQQLERGREVLRHAAAAIELTAASLEADFLVAVDKILNMRGALILCGIGKAGLIGRKLSATFASTGTRSYFLHPAEAIHGDLGCIGPTDIVLMLSNSGATEEIVRILPFVNRKAAGLIAITSGGNSPLARAADITLLLPNGTEACQHNLAPSTSTTSMLAMGDALALVVSESRGFGVEDFAELHPGGSLGRRLLTVNEAMRPLEVCRVAKSSQSIREMLVHVARPGRRTGAVMLVDENGTLEGIFTDSDLARLLEQRRECDLDSPIRSLMTTHFSAIQSGARLSDAIDVMVQRKISELPVVDALDKPIGLIDVTDVLSVEHGGDKKKLESKSNLSTTSTASASEEPLWDDGPLTLRIFGSKP